MTRLSKRLRSALIGSGILLAGSLLSSPAAVVYSGLLGPGETGLAIPTTFNGIYIDFESSGTVEPASDPDATNADSYTTGYTQPSSWDVNFFFGGLGIAYSPTFQPFVDDAVGNRSQILNVEAGAVISAEAGLRTPGVAAYGGSGRSNGSSGDSHYDTPAVNSDPAYSAFTPGAQGYLAFVLNPGAGEFYGWMRVTLSNDGSPGTIHDWAYSDEPTFEVGQIPEPESVLLLLMGSTALLRRRRAAANRMGREQPPFSPS